jgi:hypothetical protein
MREDEARPPDSRGRVSPPAPHGTKDLPFPQKTHLKTKGTTVRIRLIKTNGCPFPAEPGHTPYEENGEFSGQANKAITITDGPSGQSYPQTIYVVESFASAAKIEGVGKLYKIRNDACEKTSGTEPTTSTAYFEFIGDVGEESDFRFNYVSAVNGGISFNGGQQHPLVHQDAARLESGSLRSFYNRNGYKVLGLRDYVARKRRSMTSQKPREISESETVEVWDSGSFNNDEDVDPKHLDIFVETTNTLGVAPSSIEKLGTTNLKVTLPR